MRRARVFTAAAAALLLGADAATTPGAADLRGLRDITGIEKTPRPPEHHWGPWPWLAAGVVAAAGLAAWGAGRRRRRERPPPSPADRARQALDRLAASPVESDEAYYAELAWIVRGYLEARYGVPALPRTTAEFVEALGREAVLPADQVAAVTNLLGRCDLAKFARVAFTPDDRDAARAAAYHIVSDAPPSAAAAPDEAAPSAAVTPPH